MKLIQSFFELKQLPLILALLAIIISIPSLQVGFQADDFVHRNKLLKKYKTDVPKGSLFGLFSFTSGDANTTKEYINKGVLPWWSSHSMKIKFWRPVTEISHYIDYKLWRNSISFA